jgi:hypothetical protein
MLYPCIRGVVLPILIRLNKEVKNSKLVFVFVTYLTLTHIFIYMIDEMMS